jgi:hypothetical protein
MTKLLLTVLLTLNTAFALQYTIDIPSNVPWTDTGIDIPLGHVIEIEASGEVRFDTTSSAGANADGVGPGWDGTRTVIFDPAPSAIHLSLIGKVGGDTSPSTGLLLPEMISGKGSGFVGSHYQLAEAPTGRLFLGFNDDYFVDNSGAFRVTINLRPVPELAGSFSLLVIGCTVLLGARTVVPRKQFRS